jgi:hypothetical protein
VKQAADDPEVKKKESLKVIAKMALMHPTNVEQKVAVMFVETPSTIISVGGSNKWRAVTVSLAITAASQWIRGKMVIGCHFANYLAQLFARYLA